MSYLPKAMRISRKCRGGWWYINYGSVDICHPVDENGILRLTRKQLELALRVMRSAKRSTKNRGEKR